MEKVKNGIIKYNWFVQIVQRKRNKEIKSRWANRKHIPNAGGSRNFRTDQGKIYNLKLSGAHTIFIGQHFWQVCVKATSLTTWHRSEAKMWGRNTRKYDQDARTLHRGLTGYWWCPLAARCGACLLGHRKPALRGWRLPGICFWKKYIHTLYWFWKAYFHTEIRLSRDQIGKMLAVGGKIVRTQENSNSNWYEFLLEHTESRGLWNDVFKLPGWGREDQTFNSEF